MDAPEISVIPKPLHIQVGSGRLMFDASTVVNLSDGHSELGAEGYRLTIDDDGITFLTGTDACRFYAEQLKRHGWPEEAGRPWSHLACGVAVDNAVRAAYREALLAAEQGSGDEPPDPFEPAEAERFARWLAEQRSEPTQTGDGAAANDETRRLRLRRALRRPAGRL